MESTSIAWRYEPETGRIFYLPDGGQVIKGYESFARVELEWLQHQLWLLANTTNSDRLSGFASHAQCLFAALASGDGAVIVTSSGEAA